MLNIIIILSIYGLAFLLKESDGPFGILNWFRSKLFNNKYVGVFFFKLFDCYFCLGCWCGAAIYLISEKDWCLNLLICWVLAGGIICLILDGVLSKLHSADK